MTTDIAGRLSLSCKNSEVTTGRAVPRAKTCTATGRPVAGFVQTRIHDDLTAVAAYGTGLSRFAVIPLPGQIGAQAMSTALGAGAELDEFPDGTAAVIHTPLLTVVLASSKFGGPVFLLAGPVTPAVLLRAASGLMVEPVVLP